MTSHERSRCMSVVLILLYGICACQTNTEIASVATSGARTTQLSQAPAISYDGNVVAFHSFDTHLDEIQPDTNGVQDVFVHDFTTKVTERVNLSSAGEQANDDMWGYEPSISGDGRYVAFLSRASNLVPGTPAGVDQVYVRDRQLDVTVLVSVDDAGEPANGDCGYPFITADGRRVAFESVATNLVAGDTNSSNDVFVHDRDADGNGTYDEAGGISTVRVNVSTAGTQGDVFASDITISADGRFAVFMSPAGNLAPESVNGRRLIYLRDRDTDGNHVYDDAGGVATAKISFSCESSDVDCIAGIPRIAANGSYVAYVQRANVATDPVQQADGVYHVYAYDRVGGSTRQIDLSATEGDANSGSTYADISGDGRFVSFVSGATNLVAGDTTVGGDFYRRDRDSDGNGVFDEPGKSKTVVVSVSTSGGQQDGTGVVARISGDGAFVAFESTASNLVPDDTNEVQDIFRRTVP